MTRMVPRVTSKSSLEAVLTVLAHVSTPERVIHVGAGEGNGPIHSWQEWQVPNVLLVDSDLSRLGWSQRLESVGINVQTAAEVVGNSDQEQPFYRCSLSTEDGLVKPTTLKSLWSNLSLVSESPRKVTTLDQVVAKTVGSPSENGNWLLIDCFAGADILSSAQETLQSVDVICARVLVGDDKNDETDPGLHSSRARQVSDILTKAEFSCVAVIGGLHPKLAYAVYARDLLTGASKLKAELVKTQTLAKEQAEGLAVKEGERTELGKQLEQVKAELVKTQRLAKEQAEGLAAKEGERLAEHEKLKGEVERLTQALNLAQARSTDVSTLEKKLDALFSEQKTYIQQTTNALGQHVTRMSQQQRDHGALIQYVQSGQWPADTSLSPSYAKALVMLRDARRYDAIVVLGSMATAEFLAQVVTAPKGELRRLSSTRGDVDDVGDAVTSPSSRDLPQSLMVLEHQKDGCEALKEKLNATSKGQAVEVIHAPWIETTFQGDAHLFYAADRPMQRLSQWLRDDARVLVVVGDALSKAGHSRVAALPVLLQSLPTQVIDLVLEASDTVVEDSLLQAWESLGAQRQIRTETMSVPSALALRVNI